MIKKKHRISVHLALPSFFESPELLISQISDKSNLVPKMSSCFLAEAMLFSLLTTSNATPPYAAISAMGNELHVDGHDWLRIDPIELGVDAGNLCLIGRDHLGLSQQETDRILQTLNGLLIQDNLNIVSGSANEWYLTIPNSFKIKTFPLFEVIAKDIRAFLPTGEGYPWNKIMTELQMLLFNHNINLDRQNKKQPVVNSVWLWGEGKLADHYKLKDFNVIMTDHSFVKGMHKLTSQHIPLISCNDQILNASNINEAGEYLIVLKDFNQNSFVVIDLILELLERIKTRTIADLKIYLGCGQVLSWHRRRFF